MILLEIIRANKFATATVATPATDKPVLVPSVAIVASVAVAKQKSNKAALPEDAKLEERWKKVLTILAEQPDSQRAFITDLESDPDNAILSMAIRNVATFEMIIPRGKYDAFLLLELINKAQIQQGNMAKRQQGRIHS